MANNNRFIITADYWQLTADATGDGSITGVIQGVGAPVSSMTWAGDETYEHVSGHTELGMRTAFDRTYPWPNALEQGTIVHLFLAETFYRPDETVFACVSAGTWDDTGISHVNFYYGSSTPNTVTEITQRMMPDGTLVQGYWIELDNTVDAPAPNPTAVGGTPPDFARDVNGDPTVAKGYQDRVVYAEAISNNGAVIKPRTVSRTIRVMANEDQVLKVNINPDTKLKYTNNDNYLSETQHLHRAVGRYNKAYGTEWKAIEWILDDGVYYLADTNYGLFRPDGDEAGVYDDATSHYNKFVGLNDDRDKVAILVCPGIIPGSDNAAPGSTEDKEDFYPANAGLSIRNGWMPWYFKGLTFDMYKATTITSSGNASYMPPIVFDDCIVKDSSMSYSLNPVGKQGPAISLSEKDDPTARTKLPYSQTLWRAGDSTLQINACLYNSFINTVVGGGFTSIFNSEGAIWWDTLFLQPYNNRDIGINNFKHITTYGKNVSGQTDIKTMRFLSNSFGLSTGGIDVNGKYYYDYVDGVGADSIKKGTCMIKSTAWQDTEGNFHATFADLEAAGKTCMEYRLYFENDGADHDRHGPTLNVTRYGTTTDDGLTYPNVAGGQQFYDYDFFLWRDGDDRVPANRKLLAKDETTTSLVIGWNDDDTWGTPYHSWPIYSALNVTLTTTAGNRTFDSEFTNIEAEPFELFYQDKATVDPEFGGAKIYIRLEDGGSTTYDWLEDPTDVTMSGNYTVVGNTERDFTGSAVDLSSEWGAASPVCAYVSRNWTLRRVIDGNGVGFVNWGGEVAPDALPRLEGKGADALDPIGVPYLRFYNASRKETPDAVTLFAAQGLDFTKHSVQMYLDKAGGSPVGQNTANIHSYCAKMSGWNLQPGDSLCPTIWNHQDMFQTANINAACQNIIFQDFVSVMEQQILYQAWGPVCDMLWTNVSVIDSSEKQSDTVWFFGAPNSYRFGVKNMISDCYVNIATLGREGADGFDSSKLHIENSCLTQLAGSSKGPGADPPLSGSGDFDFTVKDSILGVAGPYPTTRLSLDNYWANDNSFEMTADLAGGYNPQSGNRWWGVSNYGVIEQGGVLDTYLQTHAVAPDFTSILPFDITGRERTSSSIPGPHDVLETGDEGSEVYKMELSDNRFTDLPLGNNYDGSKYPGAEAEITLDGVLLRNDATTRTYNWIVGSTFVGDSSSSIYTVQAGDVGKSLGCIVSAAGADHVIPFGIVKATP